MPRPPSTAAIEQRTGKRAVATFGARLSVVVGAPPASWVRTPYHKIVLGPCVVRAAHTELRGASLVVPAGVGHALSVLDGGTATLVHLDPTRYDLGAAQRLAAKWRRFVPHRDDSLQLYEDAVRTPAYRVERRVERALALFEQGLGISEAARGVRLSPSRLTHLFAQQLGFSPRTWRSWLLLRGALLGILTGESVTRVAVEAGFADTAHLSRTYRAIMGVSPTQVLQAHTRFVSQRDALIDCDQLRARAGERIAAQVERRLRADRAHR